MKARSTARFGHLTLCVAVSALALAACSKKAPEQSSADTMPADLVDRVCAMDEHASAEQAKSFGKWWIDADTDPKLQNYELQGYGQPISHSDSCSGQPSYEPYVYGLSAPYSDLYVDQPTIPDPDPGIDPAASANPINPGIGM